MSDLDDIVSDFLVESHENLDQLDRDLVELEVNPTDAALASIFRTMHTIKGTCGFLGFSRLEGVAHAAESLLSLLRDKVIGIDAEITTALLTTVDAVRTMLAVIEAEGNDGADDYPALIADLERLQTRDAAASTTELHVDIVHVETLHIDVVHTESVHVDAAQVVVPPESDRAPEAEIVVAAPEPQEETTVVETPQPQPAPVVAAAAPEVMLATGAPLLVKNPDGRSAAVDSSIRVDVDLLDTLMNLVGELVLARNQILQLTTGQQDSALAAPAQRLNLITTELQEGVMKTRMQPIGNVWSKFPRVVRDLSVSCSKHVRLEMEGAETELDKTIIEAIKDPLTHLVRNAIDHGIESPEVRKELGKPHEGRLTLRAFHEGGRVNIEISDDGKGIDAEAVRAKAIERGVVPADQAMRMGQRELLNLIFLPGFSTAATISNVSGRGVGMDVVKTNIERIGGSVDVATEVGSGSTFKISIPLTLAIIPALVVTSAGERYAIPQISLLELVRLDASSSGHGIEFIHGTPVYRLRGRLLPIVDLNEELAGERSTGAVNGIVNIVVLQADDRQFGLVVDQINDTQEIVVKPLGRLVKDVTTFAGATNMGDGRVRADPRRAGPGPPLAGHLQRCRARPRRVHRDRRDDGHRREAVDAAPLGRRRPAPGHPAVRGGPAGGVRRRHGRDVGPPPGGAVPRRDPAPGRPGLHARLRLRRVAHRGHAAGRRVRASRQSRRHRRRPDRRHRRGDRPARRHLVRGAGPCDRAGGPGGGRVHGRGLPRRRHVRGRARRVRTLAAAGLRTVRLERKRDAPMSTDMMTGLEQQFCTFTVGGLHFGVAVEKVQEVIRHQATTPVPLAPREVAGLINLRGQIVTAVDLRRRLGMPPLAEGVLPMNVVMQADDEAVSLLVDSIGDVVDVDDSTFEAPPETLDGAARSLIIGAYKLDLGLLLVLDTEQAMTVTAVGR